MFESVLDNMDEVDEMFEFVVEVIGSEKFN